MSRSCQSDISCNYPYFTSVILTKSCHYEVFSQTREENYQENTITGHTQFVTVHKRYQIKLNLSEHLYYWQISWEAIVVTLALVRRLNDGLALVT